ncbi:hypothetical protein Tco_0459169 [Tanacetum coccineum]
MGQNVAHGAYVGNINPQKGNVTERPNRRLQMGKLRETVQDKLEATKRKFQIRCVMVRIMEICRDGEKEENHSSLCVLAMKAWLGLGRYGGTKKDLKGMLVAKKNAHRSKTLSTDIEGWEKGVASTDVFGVHRVTVLAPKTPPSQYSFICVKWPMVLVLSGMIMLCKMDW